MFADMEFAQSLLMLAHIHAVQKTTESQVTINILYGHIHMKLLNTFIKNISYITDFTEIIKEEGRNGNAAGFSQSRLPKFPFLFCNALLNLI